MANSLTFEGMLTGNIESLQLENITLSNHTLRSSYDDADIQEIAESILKNGLMHPIMVRTKGENYEIVAGCRRFLGCKYLNWKNIPSCIVDLNDIQSFEFSLIENLERKSLSPLEEANAFKKYINDEKWGSQTKLAQRLGKSSGYITKRISLLKLPENVQQKIVNSTLSPSIAQELVPLDDPTMQAKIANVVVERNLPLKEARQIVKDNKQKKQKSAESSHHNNLHKIDKAINILNNAMDRLFFLTLEDSGQSIEAKEAVLMQQNLIVSETLQTVFKQLNVYADSLDRLRNKNIGTVTD